MAGHAFLKNEFTEDEKCHNLMTWLINVFQVTDIKKNAMVIMLKSIQYAVRHIILFPSYCSCHVTVPVFHSLSQFTFLTNDSRTRVCSMPSIARRIC